MSRQIPIDQLTVGMYLVGIDRPWIMTPFLRNQFKITTENQIAKLRACGVTTAEIDPGRGLDVAAMSEEPEQSVSAALSESALSDGSPADGAPDTCNRLVLTPERPGNTRIFSTTTPEGLAEFCSLLRVKMLLQVTLPFQKQQTLCTTRLLGWHERQFLLTDLPFIEGRAIEFRPGILGIVRFVESGRVFGFRTETLKGQFSPTPLLFLAFPEDIEELNLRRSPRIPVTLKTTVRIRETGATISGIARDLSLSGCRIEIPEQSTLPIAGTETELDIQLPGLIELENVPGIIRTAVTKPSPGPMPGGRTFFGIEFQFHQSDPTVPACVERFVQDQLALARG